MIEKKFDWYLYFAMIEVYIKYKKENNKMFR